MPLKVVEEFLGKECEIGKCDCLRLVGSHLADLGVELNDEFKHLLENAAHYWEHDRAHGTEKMVNALRDMLDEIPVHEMRPGDVLVLSLSPFNLPFLGVNTGNGNTLVIALKEGAVCVPIGHYYVHYVLRRKGGC